MDINQENGQMRLKSRSVGGADNPKYSEQLQMRARLTRTALEAAFETPWSHVCSTEVRITIIIAFMQANTCVNPGVFKRNRHENFEEFIRRFGRRYNKVIADERVLIDILGDDHLEGRAKSIFLALPSDVNEQGFGAVVEEMRRLLANDSMAGRLRAFTELRNLRR